jgi:hypothetical protein
MRIGDDNADGNADGIADREPEGLSLADALTEDRVGQHDRAVAWHDLSPS